MDASYQIYLLPFCKFLLEVDPFVVKVYLRILCYLNMVFFFLREFKYGFLEQAKIYSSKQFIFMLLENRKITCEEGET